MDLQFSTINQAIYHIKHQLLNTYKFINSLLYKNFQFLIYYKKNVSKQSQCYKVKQRQQNPQTRCEDRMFVNSYQNGHYTQIWDSRVNVDKNPFYKQLFKKVPNSLKNFYDKDVKSFIYQLQGNQKLCFPYDDKISQLSLHQRYLVFQIFISLGSNWSIQLGINDLNSNKKRINITTIQGKQQLKYFSFRYPLESGTLQRGTWMFLAIDLYSFSNVFKNSVFRSLDSILICSSCKIRRIFTMKEWTEFQIPKTYWLPPNIPQILQLIQYKQAKQSPMQGSLLNSSVQYSKMIESKIMQSHPSGLRNSQKNSIFQDKFSKPTVKLPQVTKNRNKQQTPLKSSKLSQKIDLTQKQLYLGTLGKSNRSLTKAELIIQKSKIRLNSLQEKQNEILKRLKSEDNRFSQKLSKNQKQKTKVLKSQNLFQSDLFKSRLQSSGVDSKISKFSNHQSPKGLKLKKNFEEDNIFKQESYSSSWSRMTEKDSYEQNKKREKQKLKNDKKDSELKNMMDSMEKYTGQQKDQEEKCFKKDIKQSRTLKNSGMKERQEIIEQDVWTQEDEDIKLPETPIEQMIQSHENISLVTQTLITKQNNQPVITKQQLNSLKQTNQLQLIYDEMIGCYYHPETNTYYEIKK